MGKTARRAFAVLAVMNCFNTVAPLIHQQPQVWWASSANSLTIVLLAWMLARTPPLACEVEVLCNKP